MKFCNKCDNMYYISINNKKQDQLAYYCRHCKDYDSTINETVCVLNTQIKKGKQHLEHIINKYTKLDPTLPRINTIPCPNDECTSNNETNCARDILYIRYDDNDLKYMYMCCLCDMIWN